MLFSQINSVSYEISRKDFGSLKPSGILATNGPYYLKSLASKSEIELVKSKDYYIAKMLLIDHVKLTFNDGSNPDSMLKTLKKVNIPLHLLPNSSTYKSVKNFA